jgi:uncharacterized protein YueI
MTSLVSKKPDLQSKIAIVLSQNKKMYLLRGVPGSGKSMKSDSILLENGINPADTIIRNQHILSTDDYFIINGKYKFNPSKLAEYHQANHKRTSKHMLNDITPLIIDNTNIMPWEMKNYVNLADKNGYETIILNPEDFTTEDNPLVITKKIINKELILERASVRRVNGSGKDIPDHILDRSINNLNNYMNVSIDQIRQSNLPMKKQYRKPRRKTDLKFKKLYYKYKLKYLKLKNKN